MTTYLRIGPNTWVRPKYVMSVGWSDEARLPVVLLVNGDALPAGDYAPGILPGLDAPSDAVARLVTAMSEGR